MKTGRECPHHVEDRINNHREGSIVCGACCRVMVENEVERGLFDRINIDATEQYPSQRNILTDWIENGNLPSCVVYNALLSYGKLEREKKGIRRKKVSEMEMCALALHYALVMERTPRSLQTLSQITGISGSRIWELDKVFKLGGLNGAIALRASDWMCEVTSYLPYSYSEKLQISEKADELQCHFSFTPLTILTLTIHQYQVEKEIWKTDNSPPLYCLGLKSNLIGTVLRDPEDAIKTREPLSLKALCDICGVSTVTVMRAKKIIQLWDFKFSFECEKKKTARQKIIEKWGKPR